MPSLPHTLLEEAEISNLARHFAGGNYVMPSGALLLASRVHCAVQDDVQGMCKVEEDTAS